MLGDNLRPDLGGQLGEGVGIKLGDIWLGVFLVRFFPMVLLDQPAGDGYESGLAQAGFAVFFALMGTGSVAE